MTADERKRIKVVHLVRTLDMGGLERVVIDLARFHNRELFEVEVVCLGGEGELAAECRSHGIPVTALQLSNAGHFKRFSKLAKALRGLKPDVLHTHNSGPHVNGVVARMLTRIPVLVHTKHGRNYVNRKWAVFQNRIASRLSSCVVPVSADAAEVARTIEKVPERLIKVIRNGIVLDDYRCEETPHRRRETMLRAIHVARLNPVKDQQNLLRAVRKVVDEVPEFTLEIAGDGQERARLEELSASLNLQKHVRFLGMRDDVADLLNAADMFVLSSLSEGISLTLLEAMAAGLPVVATDVGGNREVVVDGETGLLVPKQDSDRLAHAILSLVRDPGRADQMGRAGRQRVEQTFDVRVVVETYENFYRELLSRRKHKSAAERREPRVAQVKSDYAS